MSVSILSHDHNLDPVAGAVRLLLVEDNDVDLEQLLGHLRGNAKAKWRVHWARSLKDALELMANHEFDAALVDLTLPDATGLEIVRALVAADPSCPVVAQSDIDDEALAADALTEGAQDYLYKSVITTDTLSRSISHAITRHRLWMTQAALQETHGELDDFAHVVAHDLRAPVRTARLLADRMLAFAGPLNPEATDLGCRLDQALGRLDRMILGMLEYSGLRALDVELGSVPLLEVVAETVADVQADGEHVNLEVQLDVDPEIHVHANRDMLARVLLNLLTNSVKFAEPRRALTVMISALVDPNAITMTVADNGTGLPEGTHERVFELTERLDHNREGLGFGLAIVRRCMTKMHGSIHFDPSATDGATAVLRLRQASVQAPSDADHQPLELSTTTVSGL